MCLRVCILLIPLPSGLSTSSTRTSSVLVCFGGSRSIVAGVRNSAFTSPVILPSFADTGGQRLRVYLPPVVELILDDRAGHCHRFVRPYRWYVVLRYRGFIGIHPRFQTTTF